MKFSIVEMFISLQTVTEVVCWLREETNVGVFSLSLLIGLAPTVFVWDVFVRVCLWMTRVCCHDTQLLASTARYIH